METIEFLLTSLAWTVFILGLFSLVNNVWFYIAAGFLGAKALALFVMFVIEKREW